MTEIIPRWAAEEMARVWVPPYGRDLLAVLVPGPSAQAGRDREAEERARLLRVQAAPGHATPEQLAARWAYYGGRCWMCRGPARVFDHVKPLSRGGCNWPSNQRPACWACNGRKGRRWPFRLEA